jgi:cellulose synthase/poly-beta-1,6-N-acetylglucosamine synthase-like glycosyltransferase
VDTVNVILALAGAPLLAITLYQTVFLIAGLPSLRRRSPARTQPPRSRFAMVIPAHNEAGLIGGTVTSLLQCAYPATLRDVLVIADNCSDDTAARARAAGAICHERHDLTRRGKPYALDWMMSRLDLNAYDAVVIIDADTIVDRRFLDAMDSHLVAGEVAIQGYFGVMNPNENWLTRLGVLPASVKFRLHFPGKHVFGLSCPLAGNGMCFSAALMRRFGWNAFSITENWEYYVMLTLHGYVTTSAQDAVIYSQVARSLKLGETQRMRWMKGRLDTLQRYWRPLLRQGLREASLLKLDALIEVARPSHANLLVSTAAYGALCAAAVFVGSGGAQTWLAVAGTSFGLQVIYFLVGFAIERPPLKTWLAIVMVPWYLMWKCLVSLKGLFSLSERTWVKTTRN